MGINMQALFLSCLALTFAGAVYADEGTATYYDPPYTPSACYGAEGKGVMVMGVDSKLWNGRSVCGRRYRVTCAGAANADPHPCTGGQPVEVTAVDECLPCNGSINLSRDAFSKIANLKAGKIKVRFDQI